MYYTYMYMYAGMFTKAHEHIGHGHKIGQIHGNHGEKEETAKYVHEKSNLKKNNVAGLQCM